MACRHDLTPIISSGLVKVGNGFSVDLKEMNFLCAALGGLTGICVLNCFKYGRKQCFSSSAS